MNNLGTPALTEAGASSDMQQLRADFAKMSESVAGLVKAQTQSAASGLRDTMANAGGKIADTAADLSHSALQMTNAAQEGVKSATNDIEASIERNPLTAVLIAAGIGVVLGMISAR